MGLQDTLTRQDPKVSITLAETVASTGSNSSKTSTSFSASASTQPKSEVTDVRDSRHPLFFWFMSQLMVQMNETIGGQDPSSLTRTQFKDLVDNSIQALQASGAITEEQAAQMRDFTGQNLGLFSQAFTSQRQEWTRQSIMTETGFDSARALQIAASDNAGGGYCARGVRNMLTGMGFQSPTGHAEDWDQQLANNGWVKLRGVNPHTAPEGALLFYDSDDGNGRRARNNGGGQFGHVELVAEGNNGQRLFVSDAARRNAGGSVPDNFEGAYMYVGRGAPPENHALVRQYSNAGMYNNASINAPVLNV
jgi:hypothetical protein